MVSRRSARLLLLGFFLLIAAGCTDKKNTNSGANAGPALTPGAPAAGAVITPQQLAEQPGGVETIRIAYNLLMDKYYKPLKSNEILRAAWEGVVQEVLTQGGSDNGNAPKLTGDREADFKAFSASFNGIATRGDKAPYAFSAVNAMARSLNDDHTSFLPAQVFKQFQSAPTAPGGQQIFSSRVLPGGIGYMKLVSFPAGYQKLQSGKILADELDAALASFETQGVKGWILDLRNDGGGHTESVSTIAGRFVPNGLQEIDVDAKGQRFEVPMDGHYFLHQHPLAVLINGQSGSAAEITAAALKEFGVARLFGTRTAGAVNGAEIFPLPGQVGFEYTVVQVLAGKSMKTLDKVGVEPDEVVIQQPGKDAQLEAAQAWLAQAPTPPAATPPPSTGVLKPEQIRSELSRYGATVADIPPLPNLGALGDVVLSTPNEYTVWTACTTHALQLAQTVLDRGWQGELDQFFGNGDPFTYQVGIDIYKDPSGAQQAFKANDCPEGYQSASVPVRVGDESVAYKGTGVLLGWTQLRWRRGRLVFTTYYYSEPGLQSFDPLVQIAKAIDARYQQNPLK